MKKRKPSWLLLYALIAVFFLVIVVEQLFPAAGLSGEGSELFMLFLLFGAMSLWVHFNWAGLEQEEERRTRQADLKITVYEPTRGPLEETGSGSDGVK